MPDVTVYMNCDTKLAINLSRFNLSENDEFIFAIKNYDYIDSPYVFLFKATTKDMDENGDVLFRITPATSKHLKPSAFYNFSVLLNAFDTRRPTEYKKLTDNGKVLIDYGAQDILVYTGCDDPDSEVVSARLELATDTPTLEANAFMGEIAGMNLELISRK